MTLSSTCGEGIAERSVFAEKLGDLVEALAENLEVHQRALDLDDDEAGPEFDAYLRLANRHREIADRLRMAAGRMARYRHLPMGRHDPRLMTDRKLVDAFAKFVRLEQELLALLKRTTDDDRRLLDEMRSPAAAYAV